MEDLWSSDTDIDIGSKPMNLSQDYEGADVWKLVLQAWYFPLSDLCQTDCVIKDG